MHRIELINTIMSECTKVRTEKKQPTESEVVPIRLMISESELLNGSIQKLLHLIERSEKKKIRGKGSIILTFEGYDNRYLFKYPTVCQYLKRLFRNKPHLLYLLHPQSNLQVIALALVDKDVGSYGLLLEEKHKSLAEFTFYGIDLATHVQRLITKAVRHSNLLRESPDSQHTLINSLLDYIQYEQLLKDYPPL